MTDPLDAINAHLTTCRMEPVFAVRVELADRDDARVREAVVAAVGLAYGPYTGVAFEGGAGLQFFDPDEGSRLGGDAEAVTMPARVLTFSVPRDPDVLGAAVEAVRETHSYEEPVIVVHEAWASRADDAGGRDNPNRWWNRGFAV